MQYTTEGLVQQRFAKMARYVVNSRLFFARYFILTKRCRSRSSPLLQAAKCQRLETPKTEKNQNMNSNDKVKEGEKETNIKGNTIEP
ncbi:hypothetical protein FFWV33_15800 [Flavobacterium faecale]|uniref:Uncharacterized protein n=1 Tax=Flavobacterium faecale TaxID=1355330 RepID=A0A2S1LGK1_9FLAO|nr:hypothetical protein FFWV33_15800 [Flavobacterium faecale]